MERNITILGRITKTVTFFVLATVCVVQLHAKSDRAIQVSQLPEAAQRFVSKYFVNDKISIVKEERNITGKTYKVIFSNGHSVEFNKYGSWNEVDCKHSPVPQQIVPDKIKEYIKNNYNNQKVIEIERNSREYEVKLQNGITLEFDTLFNLKKVDN